MAELVQLRLEHGLTELEEMGRIGLFSSAEIKKIIKRRKMFEYRLRRNMKKKDHFLQYIEFEMNLLKLISKRRERLLIESKRGEIDNSIAKKINRLFKAVVTRYPEDEKLWLDQIEYLKRMKWNDSLNALFTKLLQVHSKKPKLYVKAAQWEIEENHSYDNARKILQRGILILPKSELIWREYFRMELKYVEMIRRRRELLMMQDIKDESVENDAVLDCAVLQVVYDKAVEEIPRVDFALSFIEICLEFEFASKTVNYILDDVQKKYPDKEEALEALAKRPLLNLEKKIKKAQENGNRREVVKSIYDEIFSKFDEAVQLVPTEKMWNLYLEFLFTLLQSAKQNKKTKLQARIIEKMEKAAEADCLSLDYYTRWIEMLFEKGDKGEALALSLSSAQKFNKVPSWVLCLTLHIRCQKHKKEIFLLFRRALESVDGKESYPIWQLGVKWLSLIDPKMLMAFFEKGMNKCIEVSMPLKEMYLATTGLFSGAQAARDLYKKLKRSGPLSYQLIKKMITIEKTQFKSENSKMYFEDGVKAFGSTNLDIWLEYMHFVVEQNSTSVMAVGELYYRAMKTLKPELIKDFQTRITEYCTGCGLSAKWDLLSV